MISYNIVASDTDEKAKSMVTCFFQIALGIIRGGSYPLKKTVKSTDNIYSRDEAAAIQNRMACTFVESKATVKTDLERFIKQTAVDEIMVSTIFMTALIG